MARRPRIQASGEIFHVTQHGIDDSPIFVNDDDRSLFMRLIEAELERSSWTCLAYCLMRTHYHLLIRLREETLSSGFQHLNGRYAQFFNFRHKRRGHVFESRFRDVIIESEPHRFEVVRYIHLNPVRAGVCKRPEDYPWCDYAATVGLASPDPLVDPRIALEIFGSDLRRARARYREFVEEADYRVRRGQTRVRPLV